MHIDEQGEPDQGLIDIEVAFASPEQQLLIALSLPATSTIADAIHAADLRSAFPQYCFANMTVGIWGQKATHAQCLKQGDRVEIYRGLVRDPMEARKLRALGSAPDLSGSR
jgi:putative ubiquitin-RnfH superfamily antitoxin RatB of RatAB toxin-antitoxin module